MNQSNPERTGRAMTMREIREALGHNVNPQPPVDRAAWVDGDPLLEAIARAVWEQCEHHDSGLIIDDPRNIAVAALAAVLTEPTDRAAVLLEAAEVAESFDIDASPQAVAAELRRLAVEAHDTGTQQQEAPASRLSGQHADALWDAIAPPGPDRPSYPVQHERVCRVVADIVDEVTAGGGAQQPDSEAPTADRPAVLREIATTLDQLAETDVIRKRRSLATARRLLAVELRRMADDVPAPVAQQPAALRAELKPWQLLADQSDEPLPQTERVIGGRRLGPAEQQAAAEAEQDDTVHACPGRWGGPNCRCFDAEPAPGEQQTAAADDEGTEARRG